MVMMVMPVTAAVHRYRIDGYGVNRNAAVDWKASVASSVIAAVPAVIDRVKAAAVPDIETVVTASIVDLDTKS